MVTIHYKGRLGNNLFQYVAAYIFAKKFNLPIYSNVIPNVFELPINDIEKHAHSTNVITVDDNNFMSLISSDNIPLAHYQFDGYFQLKDFILNYRNEIKNLFKLKYNTPQDSNVFVAYRIGDIINQRQMLPIDYYRAALKLINAKEGYITSDTPCHPNVIQLVQEFNLKIYNNTPNETINFGKNFNNIVLSEGSFSWWIGFLSKAKNVYYNERPRFWHGDIFVLPEWKSLNYDTII